MVNKALLKRMAGEVSVGILAEMIVDYAQGITEADEVDDTVLEVIGAIETLTAEIKSRNGKPRSDRSRRSKRENKPAEEVTESPVTNTPATAARFVGNHRE